MLLSILEGLDELGAAAGAFFLVLVLILICYALFPYRGPWRRP